MTTQYVYGLLIISILTISSLLTGSSVSAEKTSKDTIPPESIDTMMVKRLVKEKVSLMIDRQVDKVDSIRESLIDSAIEIQRSLPLRHIKHWKRYIDIEHRPNGHSYKWTWWYWIQKKGNYRDTVWDKMQIQKIR